MPTAANIQTDPADPAPSRGPLIVLAVAAGLSIANVYMAQPLLGSMANELNIGRGTIGLVVAITQVGYAIGLFFLVPLGDLINRRRLIVAQSMASAIALLNVATASSEIGLLAAVFVVGLLAVTVQILVAFAAGSATPASRGRAVGTVTSGIVTGILAARFVSGAIADFGGWRAVYFISAALMVCMSATLFFVLPRDGAKPTEERYDAILLSIPRLFWRDRVLLVRGLLALLIFAAFSTLWTALVLPLSSEPFGYSHTGVGLLGLVGLAGALAAGSAGKLADRGLAQVTTGTSLALLVCSWALIAILSTSIPALIVGIVVLDLAVQAVHVSNQAILVARHPEAGSRLIGGYMVFYSIGSALGAVGSTAAYASAGWAGVSVLGASISVAGLALWAATVGVP